LELDITTRRDVSLDNNIELEDNIEVEVLCGAGILVL